MKKTLAFLVAAVFAVTALCACLTVSAEITNLALNATVTGANPTSGNPWTDNYDASLVDGKAVDTVALADAPHDWFAFYYHADYVSNAVWNSEASQAVGTFTVDLGATASVDSVRIHMVTDEATTNGAVAPQRIKVEYSADNAAWNTLVEETDFSKYSGVAWVELKGSAAADARYIRISIGFRGYTLLLNEVEVLGTAAGGASGEKPTEGSSEESSAAPAPTVIKNVAEGKPYTGAEPSTHPNNARYNAKLTDGNAKDSLSDLAEGDWFAFYYNDGAEGINAPDKVGTLVIDLEEVFSVSSVNVNTFVGKMWGIKPPESIKVEYSEDGKTYSVLEEKTFTEPEGEDEVDKVELVEFKGAEEVNARYIKVTVKLNGIFAFLNEVQVMAEVPADGGATEPSTSDNSTESTPAPEGSTSTPPPTGDKGVLFLAVLAAVAVAGAAVAVKVRR